MSATASSPLPAPRYAALDRLRGLAMVWMTLFHFCFDLHYFGYLKANFYTDPLWTLQRTAIVTLFVFCAGVGQAIAHHEQQSWPRFWRRWCQIAACAVLVTLGSWWMFPQSFIYFGILHGMALMLIVVRLCAGQRLVLGALACTALLAPWLAGPLHSTFPALSFLNERTFNWLGLVSVKPVTEDYAPLLPWLGVMCLGMLTGQRLMPRRVPQPPGAGNAVPLPQRAGDQRSVSRPVMARLERLLRGLGRHSLSYYMLHQPVLMGLITAVAMLR